MLRGAEGMSTVESYYENYWSDGGFLPLGQSWPSLVRLYEENIPPKSRVLDVGCGDAGTSGPALLGLGHSYTGVDISESAVTRARAAGFEARVVAGADQLGFLEASFDAVVCIEVLEHLFDPLAAAKEMRRVLAPGGVLIVTTPNIAYWRCRADLLFGRWNARGDALSAQQPWRDPHIRFFNPKTLGALLRESGFSTVHVGGRDGGLLDHLPYVCRTRNVQKRTGLYAALERTRPSLFGYRLAGIGR
jgi:2-polyprenyl-6-hydroxyphenyl methylase/3-demethylubiquinone-9 3-methyltransferase